MYEKLLEISQQFLKIKNSSYKRYFILTTNLSHRMSIILGQRGVGKTTTLIQYLLEKVQGDRFSRKILYVQADHFVMGSTSLYEIAEQFQSLGGKWIAIDEIHKYQGWSKELKSIYDTFPQLNLIISGSSALEIHKGTHDLIRRSACFEMQGLSFREYLELSHNIQMQTYDLHQLCENHEKIAESILNQMESIGQKILLEFQSYQRVGYYPYFFEIKDKDIYRMTIEQNLHMTVEADLSAIYPDLTGNSIKKIKQLLMFIAQAVPFVPNWNKIKETLEIGDIRTVKAYFKHLEDAHLIRGIAKATNKLSQIEMPEKVYLDNPNQLFAICSQEPEKGTVREVFFLNMVSKNYKVGLPKSGDFLVENQYLFEVGGKNKTFEQVKLHTKAYLACDDIEQGVGRKIPLWLLGFLY